MYLGTAAASNLGRGKHLEHKTVPKPLLSSKYDTGDIYLELARDELSTSLRPRLNE